LFNNEESATKSKNGRLSVAIYNKEKNTYKIDSFYETMVDHDCGGKESQVSKPELTTPHSVSMVDFDGDCLSDLFITI